MRKIKDLKDILNTSPSIMSYLKRPTENENRSLPYVLIDYDRDNSSFYGDNTTLYRNGNIILKYISDSLISPQYNGLVKKLIDNNIEYQCLGHLQDKENKLWVIDYRITFSYPTSILK